VAEQEGTDVVRERAFQLAMVASAVMATLLIGAVTQLRERADFQGRVNENPFHAFRDVWRNPHARLLIIVTFIENVGSAAIAALTLYVAQYVVGAAVWAPVMILCYMLPSSLSVPLWIPLSRRFGKVRLWMFSMILTGLSFGSMFALPFLPGVELRLVYICIAAAFAGLAAGCGGTISPSIQGDVIDYDELQTGERKEGSYFAAWNFVYKSATGVMLLLTGFVLQAAGFQPNQEQSMTVQVAMVTLYGLFPLVCYAIGALLFRKFTLDENAHAEIRRALDEKARAAAAQSAGG
jgi:GPH family glycoside/pentoside/hexuronide:cation symporter